jgi:excisionase family DNA binding protein
MRTLTPTQSAAFAALPDRWITPNAAAFLLSVGMRTLWRLTAQGRLPAPLRFNRKLVRFDRAALVECLRQLQQRRAALVPVEPVLTCEDCRRPLWKLRLTTGRVDVFCPHCIRVSLGEAS